MTQGVRWRMLVAVAVSLGAGPALDRQGDVLPPGAVARLGSTRLMHSRSLSGLAFAPDGLSLASVGFDNTLRFWDVQTGRELRRLTIPEGPYLSLQFSPDGRYLALGASTGVHIWEAGSGKPLPSLTLQNATGLQFTANGNLLAAVSGNGVLVRAPTGGAEISFGAPELVENALAFSPDGSRLAVGGKALVRVWDVARRKKIRTYELPENDAFAVCFSPDGKTLAVSTKDAIFTFELDSEELCEEFEPPEQGAVLLRYSTNGKELISVDENGTVGIWNATTGEEIKQFPTWKAEHAYIRLSPNGRLLAAETFKGTIGLWDLDLGQERHPSAKLTPLYALSVTNDGRTAAVGTEDGLVHLFEPRTGRLTRSFTAHGKFAAALAFSPDGTTLATGGFEEPDLKLWHARTGQELGKLPGHGEGIIQTVFHPDGKSLYVTSKDHLLRHWDWSVGKLRGQFGNGGPVDILALAPDGRSLATATGDQGLCIWESATGQERKRLSSFKRTVFALAYSPDGRRLAVGIGGGMATQYDPRTGEPTRCPEQGSDIMAVTYSPNGQWLALAGDEGAIVVCHAASGEPVAKFVGHEGPIHGLAFLPDGHLLLSAALDGTVLVWDVRGLRYQPPINVLDQATAADLWTQLADADASKAGVAVARFVAHPEVAVPFLSEKVAPVPTVPAEQIRGWIRQLDDKAFTVRQQALRQLEAVSDQAQSALQAARTPTASAELRQRTDELLQHATGAGSPQRLRLVRAVEILEAVGTPPARQLLQKLATGAPTARGTLEAQAALARLAPRPPTREK